MAGTSPMRISRSATATAGFDPDPVSATSAETARPFGWRTRHARAPVVGNTCRRPRVCSLTSTPFAAHGRSVATPAARPSLGARGLADLLPPQLVRWREALLAPVLADDPAGLHAPLEAAVQLLEGFSRPGRHEH